MEPFFIIHKDSHWKCNVSHTHTGIPWENTSLINHPYDWEVITSFCRVLLSEGIFSLDFNRTSCANWTQLFLPQTFSTIFGFQLCSPETKWFGDLDQIYFHWEKRSSFCWNFPFFGVSFFYKFLWNSNWGRVWFCFFRFWRSATCVIIMPPCLWMSTGCFC